MQDSKQKLLKKNMILNALKGIMSIVFPLVTFPYVSKVLGVENLGKYSFSNSLINYLTLFSGLGISAYAIREGARIRDNKTELESFSSEMLTINLISNVASYLLFFFIVVSIPKLRNYLVLLAILSIQVFFKTIGIEWFFSIYENYIYITVRSIIFQLIAFLFLFFLVKSEEDVYVYAFITVLAGAGSGILNFFYSRKYCHICLSRHINWKEHLMPILVLFAMSATVVIYVSSDITMLGFMCDDHIVGIYTVSTKVYGIVKTILSSVLIVSIPRLSSLLGEKDMGGFSATAFQIYKTLISVSFPVIVVIIMLRKEIVLLLSDSDYLPATTSLLILGVALFFCLGAWFWGQCILIPYKMEYTVFKITVISAAVNILLNLVLIPLWAEKAAAITTIIAEALSFIWCGIEGHRIVVIKDLWKSYIKVMVGCIIIVIDIYILQTMPISVVPRVLIIIPTSILLYWGIELIMRNEALSLKYMKSF